MKQHDIHNDEALYRQMLAELAPGAEAYDKMVAEGRHPAARTRRLTPYYKYVAAACVLLTVTGGTWLIAERPDDRPQTELVAQAEGEKLRQAEDYDRTQSQEDEHAGTADAPSLDTGQHAGPGIRQASRPLPQAQATPHTEESAEAPDDTPDRELYYALLAEVEAKAAQQEQQEQQSLRALFDELIDNIEQQSNRPELSL